MNEIPNIIHQIYEGRDGTSPSKLLLKLAETWRKLNPAFEYKLWDYKQIDIFLENFYPSFIKTYHEFKYNVQRWDAIRYLILFHYGGIYADLDYECLEPIKPLIKGGACCFGSEPAEHCLHFNKNYVISNAFMAVMPKHPFFKKIIENVLIVSSNAKDKLIYVLETTGPHMISKLFESYTDKGGITLLPSELISPLSKREVKMIVEGKATQEIKIKVEKAYAIHYFFGSWC